MNRFFSWFCKIFLAPIVKALFIKEIRGKENLPRGNFILVSNHQSYLDILADAYICLPRKFHFIGQIDGFKGPLRWFILFIYFLTGVIPLERQSKDSKKKALKKAIRFLKKGGILIIYPEGRRSLNGKIQKGKFGTAKIFLKTGLPIVPAGIQGTFDLLPPNGKLKIRKKIVVNIRPPLFFQEEFEKAKNFKEDSFEYREVLEKITNRTMESFLFASTLKENSL